MFARIVCGLGIVALAGCGGNDSFTPGPTPGETALVEFALVSSNHLANHSVDICGKRDVAADPIYPCENGPICQCSTFDANGNLPDTAYFDELCPTTNHPMSPWTFTYTIWSGVDCTGTILAGPGPDDLHNLVCYDASDVYTQNNPNQSKEPILEGENSNEILCLTRDAGKEWAFDVCLDVTEYDLQGDSVPANTLRLDCGCWLGPTQRCEDPPPPTCECDFDLETLPAGCEVDPEEDCDIICTNVP